MDFDRYLDRVVNLGLKKTRLVLLTGMVLFVASLVLAVRLQLKSDFVELLPTSSPSVRNLEHMKGRIASYSTLTVAIQSPDLQASMRFADDLVARLKKFPEDRIKFIDYNLSDLREFYNHNKWLYADLADLKDFRDRLARRIQEETEDAVIESLDEEPRPKTDLRIKEFKEKYEKKTKEQDRYPKGYYVTPERDLLAVFIRPPSWASDGEDAEALVEDVWKEIRALDPARYNIGMTVGMTGEVQTGIEERDALAEDMGTIGLLALTLILGVIILYYRSVRAVILIGTPMLLGLVMSFAVAYLAIGHLNSATAFLSSIIAGNGINFMIMLAARFFEEIRTRGPQDLEGALRVSVRTTARGTVVAAMAASIAYGSLVLAGFRGFRQFGVIGGVGMLFCWISTFVFGPALIAFVHRIKPLGTRRRPDRHPVADRVAALVGSWPRLVLLTSLILTAASILVTIPYAFDPFEYDFRNLRNRASKEHGSAKLSHKVDKIFDLPQTPTPLLTDFRDQVPHIKEVILSQPNARATIGDVKTLFDFLPKQQEEKLAVLADIRRLIDRKIDFLDEEDRKDIEAYRPPEDLRVLTLEDIPDVVARPYTEADGTRGRILYVYGHPDESLLDGKYLLKFARFIRGVEEQEPFMSSGQPMVFADMVDAVLHDGLRVTVAAICAVGVLLVIAFRSLFGVLAVSMSVIFGTLWMIGVAAVLDLKLNFLNFVVIPITLGIAVDYGANLFTRYRTEGPDRIQALLRSTGGAVVLSSSTTIFGYATLITSTNLALRSFGILADIGEITTLITAEVVMTALLVWHERSGRQS